MGHVIYTQSNEKYRYERKEKEGHGHQLRPSAHPPTRLIHDLGLLLVGGYIITTVPRELSSVVTLKLQCHTYFILPTLPCLASPSLQYRTYLPSSTSLARSLALSPVIVRLIYSIGCWHNLVLSAFPPPSLLARASSVVYLLGPVAASLIPAALLHPGFLFDRPANAIVISDTQNSTFLLSTLHCLALLCNCNDNCNWHRHRQRTLTSLLILSPSHKV
jgi:hypothetical protein